MALPASGADNGVEAAATPVLDDIAENVLRGGLADQTTAGRSRLVP
jgi:hypothetical protein